MNAVTMDRFEPMRELTAAEIALVGGAFSWGEFVGHMGVGALAGGLAGAAVGGVGAGPGALGGALLGGIEYCLTDAIEAYF
jgi:hypothetical protein